MVSDFGPRLSPQSVEDDEVRWLFGHVTVNAVIRNPSALLREHSARFHLVAGRADCRKVSQVVLRRVYVVASDASHLG